MIISKAIFHSWSAFKIREVKGKRQQQRLFAFSKPKLSLPFTIQKKNSKLFLPFFSLTARKKTKTPPFRFILSFKPRKKLLFLLFFWTNSSDFGQPLLFKRKQSSSFLSPQPISLCQLKEKNPLKKTSKTSEKSAAEPSLLLSFSPLSFFLPKRDQPSSFYSPFLLYLFHGPLGRERGPSHDAFRLIEGLLPCKE